MADSSDIRYPIFVTQQGSMYTLRIRELLLLVHDADLQNGYEELLERKKQVIDWAREIGLIDELPPPSPPPFGAAARPVGLSCGNFPSLNRLRKAIF
jgi:hypothetical protein